MKTAILFLTIIVLLIIDTSKVPVPYALNIFLVLGLFGGIIMTIIDDLNKLIK